MSEELSNLDDIDPPPPLDNQIVFFDGVCGLCNRFVDFLMRHDRRHSLHFAPLQGSTARRALTVRYTLDVNTVVYFKDGESHQFSDAALRILADLGGAWRVALAFLIVPSFLRDGIYRLIARNRYRWFGKRESCRLASPAEREYLLG